MQEKIERNEELYNKKMGIGYTRPYTYRELSIKNRLSIQRIQRIIKKYKLDNDLK